jgi:hypothetical protein
MTMLTGSGSATSDVASGSSHSQDARNAKRPPASPLQDTNALHEAKTESNAIDPLSQVGLYGVMCLSELTRGPCLAYHPTYKYAEIHSVEIAGESVI